MEEQENNYILDREEWEKKFSRFSTSDDNKEQADKSAEKNNHFEIYGDSTGGVTLFAFDNDGKASNAFRWGNFEEYKEDILDGISEARAGTFEVQGNSSGNIHAAFVGEHAQNAYENCKNAPSLPDMAIYDVKFLGDEKGLDKAFEEKLLSTEEKSAEKNNHFEMYEDNTGGIVVFTFDNDGKANETFCYNNIQSVDIDSLANGKVATLDVVDTKVDSIVFANGKTATATFAKTRESKDKSADFTGERAQNVYTNLKNSELGCFSSEFLGNENALSSSIISATEIKSSHDFFIFSKVGDRDDCVITGYKGNDKDISIPSVIGDYSVIGIDTEAFSGCESLESVTIPDSVTHIGKGAFWDSNLQSATFLGNTSKIDAEEHAFPLDTKIEKAQKKAARDGLMSHKSMNKAAKTIHNKAVDKDSKDKSRDEQKKNNPSR